jgi:hypothetical protein
MTETYLNTINKDISIIIVSNLTDIDDISSLSDIITFKNLDYMRLCEMYHPSLFPVKFLYGDTIERYNWSNLYFNFLTHDKYAYNIITGKKKDSSGFNINLEVTLFLILVGKLPIIDTFKFITCFVFKFKNGSSDYYTASNFIRSCVLPPLCKELFSKDRYLYIDGAKEAMSTSEITPETLNSTFAKFIKEGSGIASYIESCSLPRSLVEKMFQFSDLLQKSERKNGKKSSCSRSKKGCYSSGESSSDEESCLKKGCKY